MAPVPRNLFVNHENFSGSWELSPSSNGDSDTEILLIPVNCSVRFGYAWRLRTTPSSPWSTSITFRIPNPTSATKGSVFLTVDFGAEGPHFGGPAIYSGAAVLFEISQSRISFEFRVNNGKVDYSNSTLIPHLTTDYSTDTFTITIQSIDSNSIKISSNFGEIYNGNSRTNLTKLWLSINAFSSESEVVILSVNSSFKDERVNFPLMESVPESVDFNNKSGLTHRQFRRLSHALVLSRENGSVDTSAEAIFEGILELDQVLNVSATVGPTKRIIERFMHNYTDSWGRRALRMLSETEILRSSLSGEAETVAFLVEDFRWNCAHELAELKRDSQQWSADVTQIFLDWAADAKSAVKIKIVSRRFTLAGLLLFVGVVESVGLFLYARNVILVK